MINTIGPVWDGNEVWLLVAGGATFAAFPEWYATLFSGFYLPLLLILVALIVRNVAFEYRGKRDDPALAGPVGRRHRRRLLRARAAVGGGLRATSCAGCRSTRTRSSPARCFTLLNPYALLGGLTTLLLFLTHGALFVALRPTARSGTGPRGWRSGSGWPPCCWQRRSWCGRS